MKPMSQRDRGAEASLKLVLMTTLLFWGMFMYATVQVMERLLQNMNISNMIISKRCHA